MPKLFVHSTKAEIQQLISQSEACQRFSVLYSAVDIDWVTQLNANKDIDLAIVYLDNFEQTDYAELQSSGCLQELDFIFLSDGKPNKTTELLFSNGTGFHFREPVDPLIFEETVSDFYDEFSTRESQVTHIKSSDLDQFGQLLGSSSVMHKLYRVLRKVAWSDSNVLIMGESGVGKELIANTIHLASKRADNPLVAINCGALSPELVDSELFGHVKGAFTGALKDKKGLFAQAESGTLFLDEITEMPLEHQVKLLRVLETGEYRPVGSTSPSMTNVRIVAATNREPAEAIAQEVLREDLYFRLAQFPIKVPPLRSRDNDVIGLAIHFLAHKNANEGSTKSINENALEKIKHHDWPGNVRELRHVIERAFILSENVISAEHIILDVFDQDQGNEKIEAGVPLSEIERVAIEKTLKANDGNRGDTAEQLGISVKTLYNKLERYQQSE